MTAQPPDGTHRVRSTAAVTSSGPVGTGAPCHALGPIPAFRERVQAWINSLWSTKDGRIAELLG